MRRVARRAGLSQIVAPALFLKEFLRFRRLYAAGSERLPLSWRDRYPCLDDKTAATSFDRHYIYHPAWAARVLARTRPTLHIDISSSLHFSSIVSAFIPVKFYDYRPADVELSDLSSESADLQALPFRSDSVQSVSCMHVVEHLGLGRYGDPLDPDADLKAMLELKRVVAPGGTLLFVVPIGKPKIMFNAHRIYSYHHVVDSFADLELKEFALVPDDANDGGLIYNAAPEMVDAQTYGCGCFWFEKKR